MNSPGASILPSLLALAKQYGQQPGAPTQVPGPGEESDARQENSPSPLLTAAMAQPESDQTDNRVRDRTEADAAPQRQGTTIPPAHSPEYDRMEQEYLQSEKPLPRPSLKQNLLRYGTAIAPLALLPLAARHGNYGAAAGAAKGVSGGVGALANTDVQNRRIAAQQQIQKSGRLLQEMEAERRNEVAEKGMTSRAQLAEQGMTNRAALQKEAEDARANNLLKVIQGQNQRSENAITSKEGLAQKAREQQLNEYRQTDDYRRLKMKLDNDTKMKVAQISANKAPAAMLQSAEFAQGGLRSLHDSEEAMARLEKSGAMGSLPANKVEDWIFGKGLVDPTLPPEVRKDIGTLRAASMLTSSATMRAHTGRSSKEIYDDIKSSLGPGQDWNALKGALQETDGMLQQYANMGSNEEIGRLRGGTAGGGQNAGGGGPTARNPQATKTAPAGLTNFHVNPTTHERIGWDGKKWVPAPQ
jgi:hypothetical protein